MSEALQGALYLNVTTADDAMARIKAWLSGLSLEAKRSLLRAEIGWACERGDDQQLARDMSEDILEETGGDRVWWGLLRFSNYSAIPGSRIKIIDAGE